MTFQKPADKLPEEGNTKQPVVDKSGDVEEEALPEWDGGQHTGIGDVEQVQQVEDGERERAEDIQVHALDHHAAHVEPLEAAVGEGEPCPVVDHVLAPLTHLAQWGVAQIETILNA